MLPLRVLQVAGRHHIPAVITEQKHGSFAGTQAQRSAESGADKTHDRVSKRLCSSARPDAVADRFAPDSGAPSFLELTPHREDCQGNHPSIQSWLKNIMMFFYS